MEQLNLTSPVQPPSITSWRVVSLELKWEHASILIGLKGPNGESLWHTYTGPTATTFMTQLNKANLSTSSLHKRILDRLVTDGVLAGTVAGSPD